MHCHHMILLKEPFLLIETLSIFASLVAVNIGSNMYILCVSKHTKADIIRNMKLENYAIQQKLYFGMNLRI